MAVFNNGRKMNFVNLNARTNTGRALKSVWNIAKSSKQQEEENQDYGNKLYRDDVYMLYSKNFGNKEEHRLEDLLNGIEKAGIEPKSIGGIQKKNNGIEIMCLCE